MKNNLFLSMLYIEMAYTRKPARKIYRKKVTKKYVKRGKTTSTKSLTRLIKSISLKQAETKSTHFLEENRNLNHNSGYGWTGLLKTEQGVTDTDTGSSAYSNRIGDSIIARGISIKLWVANKFDRPNVMYRIICYRYQSQNTPTLSSIFKGANGNKMMDDLDREYISVVYQKIFNLQVGSTHTLNSATAANAEFSKEAHVYKQIWIPLKNKEILYADGGSIPKFTNLGFAIFPYDSYGTLVTDNIASVAFQYKFYFKDP